MGSLRSVVILAVALFTGAAVGAAIGGGSVAEAETSLDGPVPLSIASGAVVAFDRTSCPAGWTAFAPARGRVVVGLNQGGTLRGTVGSKLKNLEVRKHSHTVDPVSQYNEWSNEHSHVWASYREGQWTPGSGVDFVAWGDGIDNSGSGYYPIALDFKGGANTVFLFNTGRDGAHGHQVDIASTAASDQWHRFPYVQLLWCEKN
jgi:hypothetical protein